MTEAKLDPATNEVICGDCGEVIKNITEYIKTTLRSNKEFVKRGSGSNFNVKCGSCGKMVGAIINDKDRPVCSSCGKELKLSKAFEDVLRKSVRKSK